MCRPAVTEDYESPKCWEEEGTTKIAVLVADGFHTITGFHLREQFPELVVQPTVEQFGGIWSDDQPVVIDRNLISSRHPDDISHFAGAIRDWLEQSAQSLTKGA